jgi:hypothetical protein
VGHIGTLYHHKEFADFVAALHDYATEQHLTVKIVNIGRSPGIERVARGHPNSIEQLGELPERDAIEVLSGCDFAYCMYPNSDRFKIFRRTSQPIKLTTYIQAQTPIFAHTPTDSSLASVVQMHKLGQVCTSCAGDQIKKAIHAIRTNQVCRYKFEEARSKLLGISQVHALRQALLGLAGYSTLRGHASYSNEGGATRLHGT